MANKCHEIRIITVKHTNTNTIAISLLSLSKIRYHIIMHNLGILQEKQIALTRRQQIYTMT